MSDLIRRQDAIDAILDLTDFVSVIELFEYVEDHDLQDKRSGGIIDAIDAVLLLPSVQPEVLACGEGELTVQPERKIGHWIDREHCQVDEDGYDIGICSVCGAEITIDPLNDDYCPHCGADMRGDRDERYNIQTGCD